MNHKPILFNSQMVKAIIEGRKTQTRRKVKDQDCVEADDNDAALWVHDPSYIHPCDYSCTRSAISRCPYGQKGDLLWVRETFQYECNDDAIPVEPNRYFYTGGFGDGRRVPSIHMPKKANRITLEITDVRVERIQSISGKDACAEGMDHFKSEASTAIGWHEKPRSAFRRAWTQIYGEESWQHNYWVWVVEFEPIFENVLNVIADREVAA